MIVLIYSHEDLKMYSCDRPIMYTRNNLFITTVYFKLFFRSTWVWSSYLVTRSDRQITTLSHVPSCYINLEHHLSEFGSDGRPTNRGGFHAPDFWSNWSNMRHHIKVWDPSRMSVLHQRLQLVHLTARPQFKGKVIYVLGTVRLF